MRDISFGDYFVRPATPRPATPLPQLPPSATPRDILRENRELRSVLSCHEGEAQALRTRSAKLEEIMRQFAPALLTMATIMGMAAKNEKD